MSGSLAAAILRQEYGERPNFMTPEILERRMVSRNVAVELSAGEGLRTREQSLHGRPGDPIWAVSFVRRDPVSRETRRGYGASTCFRSLADARERIARVSALLAFLGRAR